MTSLDLQKHLFTPISFGRYFDFFLKDYLSRLNKDKLYKYAQSYYIGFSSESEINTPYQIKDYCRGFKDYCRSKIKMILGANCNLQKKANRQALQNFSEKIIEELEHNDYSAFRS